MDGRLVEKIWCRDTSRGIELVEISFQTTDFNVTHRIECLPTEMSNIISLSGIVTSYM